MTDIRNVVAGLAAAQEVTCLHPDGQPPSVRILTMRTSTLVLVVAPVEYTRLAVASFVGDEPMLYGLSGAVSLGEFGAEPAIRYGSTERHPSGRMRRHLADPPVPAARDVFIVAGRTAGVLTPGLARALETEFARATMAAGSYRVIGTYNFTTTTAVERDTLARWMAELRLMLVDAGVPVLEPRPADWPFGGEGATPPPAVLRAGFSLAVPPDLARRPGVQRWRLEVGDIRATAFSLDGWTVLEPGAIAKAAAVESNQPCLTKKRDALWQMKIFRSCRGRADLWELRRHLRLPSLVNAARILAGNNSPASLWRAA